MSLEHSPSRRMLRARAVMEIMGFSRSTLWRRVRNGSFPAAVALDPNGNSIAWYEDEVQAHLAQLPRVHYAPQSVAG